MTHHNDPLRNAPRRMPSPQAPGSRRSRQELAELVNAWIHEQTGRLPTRAAY